MAREVWVGRLDEACTADALMASVRAYLDAWSPEEIAALPAHAWPHRPQSLADIVMDATKLGYELWQHGLREGAALLAELAAFYSRAAVAAQRFPPCVPD
ncbi:MAG TPA: hypothetical protein VHQ02_06800 [Usitatibacter sp.]|jgi:hypothetical protein|nr:hypothetical protein [Usitatibacter sp.]